MAGGAADQTATNARKSNRPLHQIVADGSARAAIGTGFGVTTKVSSVTLLRVDTRQDRMLRIICLVNRNARFVMSSAINLRLAMPRRLRAALALFVLTIYLLGGVAHGLCDLDVTNLSGDAVISLADKGVGHSEKGAIADHHCHGCFSVSVPAPVFGATNMMPAVKVMAVRAIRRRGLPPGIEPPPPKSLT